MKCDEIKDLVLLEYADDEVDAGSRKEILSHIGGCAECKAFAARVRKQAIAPFEEADMQEPPAEIWQNIQAKIAGETAMETPTLWERLKAGLGLSRPVWAFNAFLILFIALAVFFGQNNQSRELAQNDAPDIDVLAYVVEETEFDADVSDGFGSDIEAYFL